MSPVMGVKEDTLMPEKKPLAKRRRRRKKSNGETIKVGILTPVEQRKHMALDNRIRAFALEYLKTMNAKEAGKAIGLSTKSPASAWNYLHKPAVQKIIKEEMDKRTDASGVTEERIVNELAALAFSSVKDFVAFDGRDVVLVNSGTLTRDQAAAIQSVQSKPSHKGPPVVSIRMYDKLKALELLMRWKGMISTDGKGQGAVNSRAAAERVMSDIRAMNETTSPDEPTEGEEDSNG